ncbi:ferredoxin [Rhizobium leguminosarum]
MPKLTIVAFDGTRFDLDVDQGSTVMENAVRNSVPGIEAECGGACACATCHVYVDEEWTEKVGQPGSDGRGHARLRLRCAPDLAAVLSDPDEGCL